MTTTDEARALTHDPFDAHYRCATCGYLRRPDYHAALAGRNSHAEYDTSGTGSPTFKGFCGPLEDFDPAEALKSPRAGMGTEEEA